MSTKFKITYDTDNFTEGDIGIKISEEDNVKANVGFTGHDISQFRHIKDLKDAVNESDDELAHNKAVMAFLEGHTGVLLNTPVGYNNSAKSNYLEWKKTTGEAGLHYILKGYMDENKVVPRDVDFLVAKGGQTIPTETDIIIICNGKVYHKPISNIIYYEGEEHSVTAPLNINISCYQEGTSSGYEFNNYIGLGVFGIHHGTSNRVSGKHEIVESFPYVKGGTSTLKCDNGNGIYTTTVGQTDTVAIPVLREPNKLWNNNEAKFIIQDNGVYYVRSIQDGYIQHKIGVGTPRAKGTYTVEVYRIIQQNTTQTGNIPYVSGTDYKLDISQPHNIYKIGECKFTVE